jgi:WhiB family transcriptional regulator, redox-sensing transcriptional regulator
MAVGAAGDLVLVDELADVRSLVAELLGRPAWHADAACRGTDVNFFPVAEDDDAGPAIAVCEGCPVRRHCLSQARDFGEEEGVWGGILRGRPTPDHVRRPRRRKAWTSTMETAARAHRLALAKKRAAAQPAV